MVSLTLCWIVACLCAGSQAQSKPSSQGPEVRRVCVDSLDIRLGDGFEKVSEIISLSSDPNGPSDNSNWSTGKNTDFYSTSGPEHIFDDGGTLRSAVYCTFDDRRRLRLLQIAWTYDGEHTMKARDAVVHALLSKIHKCLNNQLKKVSSTRWVARIDYGTYSQELMFDSASHSRWQITYTISEEPKSVIR